MSWSNHDKPEEIQDLDDETSSAISENHDESRNDPKDLNGLMPFRSLDGEDFPDFDPNSNQGLNLSSEDNHQNPDYSNLTSQQIHDLQEAQNNERRSSARNVKRKKFADEIVEASLRPAYYRNRSGPEKITGKGSSFMVDALLGNLKSPTSIPRKDLYGSSKNPVFSPIERKPKRPYNRKAQKELLGHPVMTSRSPQSINETSRYSSPLDDPVSWWENELNGFDEPSSSANQFSDPKKPKMKKKRLLGEEANGKRSWMALDDLKLITAMQQLCDFPLVAKYVTFGTKMDTVALQQRWLELLEDPEASRDAVEGIDRIPLDTIQRIRKMRFFTSTEEDAIKSIPTGHANVEEFDRLLRTFSHLFFPGRQPEDLLADWKYLSQRVKTALGNPPPASNPELPENLNEVKLKNRIGDIQSDASCFGRAMINLTHHLNYRSKHVGCEVAYLKALGERVATGSLPDQQHPKFQRDHRTSLAFLSGVCVDYALVSEEATFGYSNEDSTVDIDLSLEGSIANIEPLQGVIFLDVEGAFRIENRGVSSVYVNRFLLSQGDELELPDNSSVEVGTLTFQFYKNGSAIKRFVDKYVRDSSDPRKCGKPARIFDTDAKLDSESEKDDSENDEPGQLSIAEDEAGQFFADERMDEDNEEEGF